MAGGEHAIGIAVAAIARQPHRVFDPAEGGAVGGVHQQRTGCKGGGFAKRCAAPESPEKRSTIKGWCIIPNTGVPLCNSAINVPQIGKPAIKDLVPSIGSITQTYSASSCSLPNSSPTMPCWGKLALISRRITASAARSASVTGSKSWLVLLLSVLSEVLKNGRMVSPEEVARRPMKAVKSMTITAVPYGGGAERVCRLLPSPILQA